MRSKTIDADHFQVLATLALRGSFSSKRGCEEALTVIEVHSDMIDAHSAKIMLDDMKKAPFSLAHRSWARLKKMLERKIEFDAGAITNLSHRI